MSAEVILTRLGLLAGDEEADILPHFQRVFPVLLDLISAAGRTGQEDADLLEHASECLTYLLKYRARYVISELPKYLGQYAVLLKHKKIRIRHFFAESLALVFRRIPSAGMRAAMFDAFQLFGSTENPHELNLMADGLSVLFAKTVKGVQHQFRSKTIAVLTPLFKGVRHSVTAASLTKAQRAAQLRAIRMAVLRMRNHARSLDSAADLVEVMFSNFRAVSIRYVNAAKGRDVANDSEPRNDDSESESEDSIERPFSNQDLEQEVLFYLDLVVSWVYAKPRPRDCCGESWQAFVAVAVECLSAIVEAGNLTPANAKEKSLLDAANAMVLAFPPVAMAASETAKRALLLLWRAMPSIVAPCCDDKLAAVFAGPDSVEAQSALLLSGNDESLSLACAALIPDMLPGFEHLLPRLSAATAAGLMLGETKQRLSNELCISSAQLHTWRKAEPEQVLEEMKHVVETLDSFGSLAPSSVEPLQLSGAMAYSGALLRFLKLHPISDPNMPSRLALLLPKASSAMLLARFFDCCISSLHVPDGPTAPPREAWPSGQDTEEGQTWDAWAVAWAQSEPSGPGPLFAAVSHAFSNKTIHTSEAILGLMPCCWKAAQSAHAQIRLAALRVALLLPQSVLARCLQRPDCGEVFENSQAEETANIGSDALQLLELCVQLENIPPDFHNERRRSEQIRRIGRALKGRSWASMLAMQILASQFSVRLATLWAPAQEALLESGRQKANPENKKRAAEGTVSKRKKRRVTKTGVGDTGKSNDGGKLAQEGEAKGEGFNRFGLLDFAEVDLEPFLRPPDYQNFPENDNWWWTEMTWSIAVAMISAQEARSEESGMAPTGQPRKQLDPLEVESWATELWKKSDWRKALDDVWKGRDSWNTQSVAAMAMHGRAWQLASKLLQQRFWSKGLEPWEATMRQHHEDWLLAKLLQHLCRRYEQGLSGKGTYTPMVHALEVVGAMPSIERCARPLVQQCIHACVHWLLLEDSKLQRLAVAVLAKCQESFPFVSQCEEPLKRLCDDATFSTELLSLSSRDVSAAEAEADVANVLFENKDRLLPLVLRILFSKATRKGKQLDKRSTQSSRRGSVFAYLSSLTDEASLSELFLVVLGAVMMVLSSETLDSRVTSSIARMASLRRAFSQEQVPLWWSEALGSASRWGRKDGKVPAGWAWRFGESFVLLDVEATPQRLFGVLQTLGEVIPQMATKLRNSQWPQRLMELVASVLERAGRISQSMERSEQMHITRQCLRAAILRCKELIEQFPERLPEMLEALKPAKGTLDFLVQRLAQTSGAVQTSAVVLLVRSWSCEPALFPCFEAFPVLQWFFQVPAANAVRAMIADSGRAGDVVPIVAEVALRLCRGSMLETTRKARRLFRDVKRELRKRSREGDESGSDEEEMVDKEAQEAAVQHGISIVRPHVDVLLSSMHELVQHRLHIKGKKPKRACIATPTELSVLASVSEWCSDEKVARQLVQLLMTVLSSNKKGLSSDSQLMLTTSIRRLVFVALPGQCPSTEEPGKKSQATYVSDAIARLLGHVKDVSVRGQLAELLVEVEAIKAHDDAKAYLKEPHGWQPEGSQSFTALHVAHLLSALNSLRRSGLREPDVDAHVEILQTLADSSLVDGKVIPATMLTPLLHHCLFLLSCEGVDLGVQRGAERVLCCLADRLRGQVQETSPDRQELCHLTFTITLQTLRRMLKAPTDDVFRTALRVLSHYVRHLAPHCEAWKSQKAEGSVESSVAGASAFGASPEALLHQDLLPLLATVKGDEGGDLFANLLHLQKHRRGRGLLALSKFAGAGSLTSTTLTHFVVPLALQAILQHGASNAAFDPNYAETGIKCLGECMHGVSWSTCLQLVRQLAFLLSKNENRERWIVRGACECLQRFPLPQQELPSPELLHGFGTMKLPDVLDAFPEKRRPKGGKGKKGKGKGKARGKGRSKGKGKGGKGRGTDRGSGVKAATRENIEKEAAELEEDNDEGDEKEPKEESDDKEADGGEKEKLGDDPELEASEQEKGADQLKSVDSIVKSLRSTVLPILRKMWQEKPKGSEGKSEGSKTPAVRIAVISVMMHCLRHLPADDFASELPKILGYVVQGLKERDPESRRASRQALQNVSASLGPKWLPWIVRELRSRLDRGYMVPVRSAAVLAALQALTSSSSLQSGDLDTSLQELLTEAMEELERQMASKEAETGEEAVLRPGQVPEAKKPKGPDFMLLAGQFSSPNKVLELIWALDRKLKGESIQEEKSDQLPRGMVFLRKVEELMTKAMSGLCLNTSFIFPEQISACNELLQPVADILAGKSQSKKEPEVAKSNKAPKSRAIEPAKSRESAFRVQEGAASGKSGGQASQQGVDDHARAGALGVLGLRLLRHILQGTKTGLEANKEAKGLEDVVPAVVSCFCSRQDRLFVASAKCLGLLRGYFDGQPEVLGRHGVSIARTVLKTFEITAGAPRLSQHLRAKAKMHGLASGADAMLATSTRLLSALLNNRDSAEWFQSFGGEEAPSLAKKEMPKTDKRQAKPREKKEGVREALQKSTVFDALVSHIQNALDTPSLQSAALQLLRRVLLRNRVLTSAVYQCIDTVGGIMITGSDKRTSQQCAQIFVDFMLDYPHEHKALQQRMNHLLKNLGYQEDGGRRAALNCLYLVVLHFPESQLSTTWGSLIFTAAAARLSSEADATSHQMIHVLILTLLRKINAPSRQRLLDLVLKWTAAPSVLAECLGLFVEAGEASESTLALMLSALVKLLQEAISADAPWQVSYAICKSFERILASVPHLVLNPLLEGDAASSMKYLWHYLLGSDAFAETRHAWIIAVALRCLEDQSAKWLKSPASLWFQGDVSAYRLLGALEVLVTSRRVEVDTSLAPLAVKALRNFLLLLLQQPDLVQADGMDEEDESDLPADEHEAKEQLGEESMLPPADDGRKGSGPNEQKLESATQKGVEEVDEKMEEEHAGGSDEELEGDEKKSQPEKITLEDGLEAPQPEEALAEPDGGRQGSLYDEAVAANLPKPDVETTPLEMEDGDVQDRLRRSRMRWLLVRWSHQSQGFQANPTEHFVRLISWFRLCTALEDQFPAQVLSQLLRPLLSPAYRCTTAFKCMALPDIVSLEQALALRPAQQRGFLANLAQSFLDQVSDKMTSAGKASEFTSTLNQVRKVVEKRRQERVQKRRLQPVTNPEAAAASRRAKNRRRAEGKKRKLEELIHNTKGGRGKHKVKQSKSLVS